jgi:superfamily II DNA or RNA helicase
LTTKNLKWARDKLQLQKVNEVYLRVVSEASVIQELSDHLTFMVPGAKFSPAFKNKFWDGKIRLLNSLTGLTYTGLVKEISEFAASRNYDIEIDPALLPDKYEHDLNEFKLTKEPRDYQLAAFENAISKERGVFLSPTASGKSLIIFLLARYYNMMRLKTLVIVPTVSLVMQMKKDFDSYTTDNLDIHSITAGVDKVSKSPIVISTWQSIYKMPKDWFSQFGCVLGDEVHLFKATSLKSIMEKLINCRYRYGFTGTLDDSQTNKITLEGLFGPVNRVITTTELMEQNYVASLKIKAIILKYPSESRLLAKNFTYQQEMDFIVKYEKRNKFIRNLTLSLTGNSLILFQYVEKHGKLLYDMLTAKDPQRKIYFVHGGVDGDDRERIREIVDSHDEEKIIFEFGNKKIICSSDNDVLLSSGITKKAKNITLDDDISDVWIINN